MTCAVSSYGSKLLPVRTRRPFSSSKLKVSMISLQTSQKLNFFMYLISWLYFNYAASSLR